jgi:hypothetical protein
MKYALFLVPVLLAAAVWPADVVETLPVDRVWSGHPVGFSLLTDPPMQYAAYYNAERQMVIASRRLVESAWTRTVLPETLGWDSHNSVTMAVDSLHRLHVSGNMHGKPLVYFRAKAPWEAASLERVAQLVGSEEVRVTYPRFLSGPAGELIFTYRDGSSGNGNQIYDVYDPAGDSWSRLLDRPLTDGQGLMNAYLHGPVPGPDGWYHLVWVWRDTPDSATNHDVSYMRSRDLRHWENVRGEPLELPVTIESPGTIVDPVPPGGGLINGNATLGFVAGKPVVTYHKYDAAGKSQVFNARWDGAEWVRVQATSWDDRWDFGGNGSIPFDVHVYPVEADESGGVAQEWSHWKRGRERWQLDPVSLRAIRKLVLPPSRMPPGFGEVAGDFPGLQVRSAGDLGQDTANGVRYVLRWETLGPNRDQPREGPLPEPSELVLYGLRD